MALQTIPISWAARQASGAVENGLELANVFERALITPLFGDDRDRISPLQLTLLYASLIHDTEDGMHLMARRRFPTEVGKLAHTILTGSRQLGEGLEALAKFYKLCFPTLSMNLTTDGDFAFLALQFQEDGLRALLQEDVQLGSLYLSLTAFLGRPFPLAWVATRDPSHMNINGSHWALKCRVKLQACAGLAFPKSLLTARSQANEESNLAWDPLETWITFIEEASPLTLNLSNAKDLRVDRLAHDRGIGSSTYRRMVSKTDRGFREMRERALTTAALELLQDGTSTLDDVAYSLGYSDERSFRRFVKRATGLTPTEIRKASKNAVTTADLKVRLKETVQLIAG